MSCEASHSYQDGMPDMLLRWAETYKDLLIASAYQARALQTMGVGIMSYTAQFMTPFWIASQAFWSTEREKVFRTTPLQTLLDYLELLQFNQQIAEIGFKTSLQALTKHQSQAAEQGWQAWLNTVFGRQGQGIDQFTAQQSRAVEFLVYKWPQAISEIRSEFGFHFDQSGYQLEAETDRFWLYQALPQDKKVEVFPTGKPVVILPPYVLGANILAFLPAEGKSYVHSFANQGVPTYVRIMKDINVTEAVQTMSVEDEARDTGLFCRQVAAKHGRPATLNGFCQGGFVAVLDLLSGELDEVVDALITCVAPMDGTRSKALVEYLEHIPPRFRDLGYAVKVLPNGNRVVDGKVMSWVYKLKSMENEAPLFTFLRDLKMFLGANEEPIKVNKTAAALNHWLIYDRGDLPEAITKLSFDSYTIPVTPDGELPVKLMGHRLNFNRLKEKGIKWLICVADKDDLVDKESALAPLDYVDAEVTVFPKGHGAIATSWSLPTSECALHSCFGEDKQRGPVRFHLDLQGETAD